MAAALQLGRSVLFGVAATMALLLRLPIRPVVAAAVMIAVFVAPVFVSVAMAVTWIVLVAAALLDKSLAAADVLKVVKMTRAAIAVVANLNTLLRACLGDTPSFLAVVAVACV